MSYIDKIKLNLKPILFVLVILIASFFIIGETYSYFFAGISDIDSINGGAMSFDLQLNVTKVLPVNASSNSILLFQFEELADNLNKGCVDKDGEYSLCQLYKIELKNNDTSSNANIKGSLSFNNRTIPNLSWILLGDTYSSSTTYTSDMLGDSFNTAVSTPTNFVDNYLLSSNGRATFYILVWVNEIDTVQYDRGSYTATVRIEDYKGKYIDAEFEG